MTRPEWLLFVLRHLGFTFRVEHGRLIVSPWRDLDGVLRFAVEEDELLINALLLREADQRRVYERSTTPSAFHLPREEDDRGFIYLLASEYGYKIGKTRSPCDRLRFFKVALPFEFRIVELYEVKDMTGVEGSLHGRFQEKRLNGEWFDLTEGDIVTFRAICELSGS